MLLTLPSAPLSRSLSVDDGLVDSALNAAYEDTVVASGMVNPNGCRPPVTWFTDGRSDCSAVQVGWVHHSKAAPAQGGWEGTSMREWSGCSVPRAV